MARGTSWACPDKDWPDVRVSACSAHAILPAMFSRVERTPGWGVLSLSRRRLLAGLLGLAAAVLPWRVSAFQFEPVIHTHMAGEAGARSNAYLIETEHGVVAVDGLLTASEGHALRATLTALRK